MPATIARSPSTLRRVARTLPRSVRHRPDAHRFAQVAPASTRQADQLDEQFIPPAYVDYGRRLTAEGGIAIAYKDLDLRFHILLQRALFWLAATGGEGWFVVHHSPVANPFVNAGCLVAAAVVNWLIVRKPEICRTIEIRPDCMIIEGRDVFWLRYMEAGWPAFEPSKDEKDSLVLTGIYGTRQVEFLTARRFDEFDRSPEVLAAHLNDAMSQLWTQPR